MITGDYVRTMADYNSWQNDAMLGLVDGLDDRDRRRDMGAFFGSIDKTLNHLLWGDQIWMHRLAGTAKPEAKSIPDSVSQFADWHAFKRERKAMDGVIKSWATTVQDEELSGEFGWFSPSVGRDVIKQRVVCIVHMFNHQTHHRGQVHAMITRLGIKTVASDLIFMPD